MADLREAEIRGQFRENRVLMARSSFPGGHDASSAYVDLFWTPIVGPSVTALLRWAQLRLARPADPWLPVSYETVEGGEICEALGRLNPGKACAVVTRAVAFHCADLIDCDGIQVVAVRSRLQTLSPQRIEQLSGRLKARHVEMLAEVTS